MFLYYSASNCSLVLCYDVINNLLYIEQSNEKMKFLIPLWLSYLFYDSLFVT